MKPSTKRHRILRHGLFVLVATTFALGGHLGAQPENLGKIQQGLVGGALVSSEQQEEFGLLDLGGYCSASLLRNDWAITAAHCVEQTGKSGRPLPDPGRPGQNLLDPLGDFTLTANWKEVQTRQATRVITFRPYDIAIIRVSQPFQVGGRSTGFSRLIYGPDHFPNSGKLAPLEIMAFGRGIHRYAQGSGASATPSQRDGKYRVGFFKTEREEDELLWYPSQNGQMMAGGDSGGPSFSRVMSAWALVGVHSEGRPVYMPGKPKKGHDWITSAPESSDAPVAKVWGEIDRYLGAFVPDGGTQATGFIGTFGNLPKNYAVITLYAVQPDGKLLWYQVETGARTWQGPKTVGMGWNDLLDIVPAGGNNLYALRPNGTLSWYGHTGWDSGAFVWKDPVEVGSEWNSYTQIFGGGEGVMYGIRPNGDLVWHRNQGHQGDMRGWNGTKVIGSAWGQFKQVISTGEGKIYAIRPNGELLFYHHLDYLTGGPTWAKERAIANNWHRFQHVIPAPNGVLLAITADGKLLWYKHTGQMRGGAIFNSPVIREGWQGPVEIGSGWGNFRKVTALLPGNADVVR